MIRWLGSSPPRPANVRVRGFHRKRRGLLQGLAPVPRQRHPFKNNFPPYVVQRSHFLFLVISLLRAITRSPVRAVVISSDSEGDRIPGNLERKALWGWEDLVRSFAGRNSSGGFTLCKVFYSAVPSRLIGHQLRCDSTRSRVRAVGPPDPTLGDARRRSKRR
jgi:hypothetical protein